MATSKKGAKKPSKTNSTKKPAPLKKGVKRNAVARTAASPAAKKKAASKKPALKKSSAQKKTKNAPAAKAPAKVKSSASTKVAKTATPAPKKRAAAKGKTPGEIRVKEAIATKSAQATNAAQKGASATKKKGKAASTGEVVDNRIKHPGWGGRRSGQGRRARNGRGEIVKSKPHYVTLTDEDNRKLRLHGGGSLTVAVRNLSVTALEQKEQLKVVVTAAGRGQGVRVRDEDGVRIPVAKFGIQLDPETVDRVMDYSQGGLSAGIRKLAALLDEDGKVF